MKPITTFSIVAYDSHKKEWGVAVQSKFMAVGAVVPWAEAGVGAVATQSYANLRYGSDGLQLMGDGLSAEKTISILTEADHKASYRQVGMVDAKGNSAAFTGEDCHDWAGHHLGDGYACQGNMLVAGTVEAMATCFEAERSSGQGELADWLVASLTAGQEAGGDSRGRQAASVLVVRAGGGYGGNNDRYLDLRVDDDPYPIKRLGELLTMHHLYFGEPNPEDLIPIAGITRQLQQLLQKTGHYAGELTGTFDPSTRQALRALVGTENLEERWDGSGEMIDQLVVTYLVNKYGESSKSM